jgi:hypothetical protein
MIIFFLSILLISVLALVVGIVKPKWIILWRPSENRSRKTVWIYFGSTILGCVTILCWLIFNWIMSAIILILLIGIVSVLSILTGLIMPTKILTLGKRTRRNVFLQYGGLFIILLIAVGSISTIGMAEDEGDETVVLGEYKGERKGELRHGEGRLANNSTYYVGSWEKDKRSGFGTEVVDLGILAYVKYEGHWKNDKKHGEGTQTMRILWMEMKYAGEWEKGKRQGFGKFIDKSGNIYEGEWEGDSPNGEGKMILTDGEIYEGEVKGWNRHGYGKATLSNGEVLEGKWTDDEFVE